MTGHPDLSPNTPSNQPGQVLSLLDGAVQARAHLIVPPHNTAFRLFNGFYEGDPRLVIDIYSQTLVIFNHADNPNDLVGIIQACQAYLLERFPWLQAIVVKPRNAASIEEKRGVLVYGAEPDTRIKENGVWYALDLFINQDTSFYLDTRNLRVWSKTNLAGKRVLNTFAHTGSLGVAARAGGAQKVVYLDLSHKYLNLAKKTYSLNGFPISEKDYLVGDFWVMISRLKRSGELFDCAFIDPPFFAKTSKGTIDLIRHSQRLINKVRPLISHDGFLVVVNNALFVSGSEFLHTLEELCSSGYLKIETLIPIPEDVSGYIHTRFNAPPVDPTPFNHPTKIAVLSVRRKDKRNA